MIISTRARYLTQHFTTAWKKQSPPLLALHSFASDGKKSGAQSDLTVSAARMFGVTVSKED